MKIIKLITIVTIFAGTILAKDLKTQKDSISYALGMDIGRNLAGSDIYADMDIEIMAEAMADAYQGKEKMSEEDYQRLVKVFQAIAQEKQAKMAAASSVDQKAFLEENKKDPDVKTTPSGLQYKVIKEGTGRKPTGTEKVKVHYTGKLIDGSVFDSSVERGQPLEFALNQVIPGWTEGLQLMKEGAKYQLFIPSELGYGERGAGAAIPAGATLIFEVELLEIK